MRYGRKLSFFCSCHENHRCSTSKCQRQSHELNSSILICLFVGFPEPIDASHALFRLCRARASNSDESSRVFRHLSCYILHRHPPPYAAWHPQAVPRLSAETVPKFALKLPSRYPPHLVLHHLVVIVCSCDSVLRREQTSMCPTQISQIPPEF